MRAILRFLMRHDIAWPRIWAGPVALWLISILLMLAAFGAFTSTIEIDERQNRAFGEAVDSQPPLLPIAAAFDAGGPVFGPTMREALKNASNGVRQAQGADQSFAKTRPAEAKQAEWSDIWVCGVPPAWGKYRELVRTLVLKGYAECSDDAKFAARSPVLYWNSGWPGHLIVWLSALITVLLSFGLIALYYVRRAYRWLYSSSVV